MQIFPTSGSSAGRLSGRAHWLITVPVLTALTLSSCSGTTSATDTSSDVASANEVASLDDTAALSDVEDTESTLDADEAALEFSACLREQGLDVADIGVDADGNIQVRDALNSVDRTDGSFREAMNACTDIIADAGFGGGRGGLQDNVEIQDALVELTDCMRDQGFDEATELTLGQAGGGQAAGAEATGEPPADGQRGQGEGQGQGDRTARFITQMGLDPEDPAVVEAMDVCAPIIDDAFTAAGVGQPGGN
jgi:hypothetical protein